MKALRNPVPKQDNMVGLLKKEELKLRSYGRGKTEERRRKLEGRRWKSEVRRQKTEDGRRK